MPLDKTRTDMAGKKRKNLLRSLLGLPTSRQLDASCQASAPPMAFNYEETAEGRSFYSGQHGFESEEDISAPESIREEIGQPYPGTVEVERQPPAPSFVNENARPNELHSYSEQNEAHAFGNSSNKGDIDKSSQAVNQSTETANSMNKASNSLGGMREVTVDREISQTITKPEAAEAAIANPAPGGQMLTSTKTPVEQRPPVAATQTSVDTVSQKGEMSTTPTTLEKTAREQVLHRVTEPATTKTTSAIPAPTRQFLTDNVLQVDTNSSTATEEIQVPGTSLAKQLFPSLLEGPPVDLQAGSQGHKKSSTVSASRQPKEEPALLSETPPADLQTGSQDHKKSSTVSASRQPKEEPALLAESNQTNSLPGSIDTQSQRLRVQDKSSANPGPSVTVSGKNSIPSRTAQLEKKQGFAAKNRVQESSPEMSQILPAAVASPEEMPRQAIFTAQGATHADSEKVVQLRQSFHQLMVKKLANRQEQNKQHTAPEEPYAREEEAKEQPAIQQVVVVQRNAASRRSRQTAAFWERSYSGRSWLKMIR